MDFEQAKIWLKDGKKIKKLHWGEESFWKLSDDKYGRIVYPDDSPAKVHLKQLEDDDWELYKEHEHDLSDISSIILIKELMKRSF